MLYELFSAVTETADKSQCVVKCNFMKFIAKIIEQVIPIAQIIYAFRLVII